MQSHESFEKAIQLHQSGQTAAAEAAYTQILAARPDHAGALHMPGVVRQQQGRNAEALELIGPSCNSDVARRSPPANGVICPM
jgi:hypothetical protein